MSDPITILIVDDHAVVRRGARAFLFPLRIRLFEPRQTVLEGGHNLVNNQRKR
jgi:hypothetical protein